MADDTEILSARFEGDVSNLKAAVTAAKQATASYEAAADRNLGNAGRAFAKLGGASVASLGKIGAALGAAFSVQMLRQLAAANSHIADMADQLGLTTQRYQELSNAVRMAGVQQATFDQSLSQFSGNMGELRNKTGGFYEFLRQSLPSVLKQIQATRSQSEAFDVVAEAVHRLDSAQSRAVLVQEAFGRGSRELALALQNGVEGLEQSKKALGKTGLVSEEAIRNTKKLGDKLDAFWTRTTAAAQELAGTIAGKLNAAMDDYAAYYDRINKQKLGAPSLPSFNPFMARSQNGWKDSEIPDFKTTVTPAKKTDTLSLQKIPNTQGAEEILKLQQQLASARGEIYSQIREEESTSLASIQKLQRDNLMTDQQMIQARALISATAEAKRVETRKQTDQQLNELRIQALEAEDNTFAALQARYEQDAKAYQELLDKKLISEAQFAEARKNLQAISDAQMQQATAAAYTDLGDRIGTTMSAVTSAIGAESDKQFAIVKAASVATVLLKSYESITSAFAAGSRIGGPPVGFAYAAIAAAATAAQLLAIKGVSSNSGGAASAAAASSASSAAPAAAATPAASSGGGYTGSITVRGLDSASRFSREEVIGLMKQIVDLQRDGYRVQLA